jgi:hypothetical protein
LRRKRKWNKDKTGYEPAFKNANSGVMKIIGNGPQTQSRKKASFLSENIYQCKKRTIKLYTGEGDFIEQSELGLESSLLMVIPKSR